jgi:hypothetical protein
MSWVRSHLYFPTSLSLFLQSLSNHITCQLINNVTHF